MLVHAGSTMAIEMHWLKKPSFQFGDVNSIDMPDGNWWQRAGTPISQVSPFFTDTKVMADAIKDANDGSNASDKAIQELEAGRYGKMDGNATKRAASLINELSGDCNIKWPTSCLATDTSHTIKDINNYYSTVMCSVCDEPFLMANQNIFTSKVE